MMQQLNMQQSLETKKPVKLLFMGQKSHLIIDYNKLTKHSNKHKMMF